MTKRQNFLLSSERTNVRQFVRDDLDFLVALHSDPKVMRYIGPLRSRDQVSERLDRIINTYDKNPGLGIWKATLKASGEPIGWACLKDLDGSAHLEIGYRLASRYWGMGYATELSLLLLHHGFQKLNLDEIVAVCQPENLASRRVLEKVGLRFVKKATYYRTHVLFFSVSRDVWNSLHHINQA